MPPDAIELSRGVRHLRRVDPILKEVIRKTGPYGLELHRNRFQALVFSILAQQISGSAARAIRKKLEAVLAPEGFVPERICRFTIEELRMVGLSRQKAAYILDLSQRVASKDLQLNRIDQLSDEDVIEALVQLKGIGVWTAQMFLIFSLGRLDVFPHTDLGIRTAIQRLYGLDELPDRDASHRIAEPWRPYASIASWYCWRSLEMRPPTQPNSESVPKKRA